MDKLKSTIEKYGRWSSYDEYIRRIELVIETDLSACVEICKSLIEGVARHICQERGQTYSQDDNVSKLVKLAFGCLGYDKANVVIQQIGAALATIGQNIGTLRNEIGLTAHGATPDEINVKKNAIKKTSSDFLISSTEIICCFLIEMYETEFPRQSTEVVKIDKETKELFDQYLDDSYGTFEMGDYSYLASEIFPSVDIKAYSAELKLFSDDLGK